MVDGLEGRLDGERPENLGGLLDSIATLWDEIAEKESSNLFLSIGSENYDFDKEVGYVSVNYQKLRRQYGFVGPSDLTSMLEHYKRDLNTEIGRLVLPELIQEVSRIYGLITLRNLKTPLKDFIFKKDGKLNVNFQLLFDYFEIRPSQIKGENPQELILRAYITYSRDLLRGDIPVSYFPNPTRGTKKARKGSKKKTKELDLTKKNTPKKSTSQE